MRDLIYYYDKTTFEKHELGEIQIGFNQSFVIDGTKDSKKVEVYSFNGKRLEPNTIIFHLGTQTWWIVSHDKVERYESEQTPLYLHNLQLEGAIELFNARDLTDNGFNDYSYDVDTFIKRLLALSTFEFNHTDYNGYPHSQNIIIDYQNNIAPTKTVDYIKTFENYTLLSALREFLDGYNCSAKLEFTENGGVLVNAKLIIVSKTGNSNKPAINGEQIFKDPRETKNTDKNNFGTSVVSNAENVVSTKTKTYPSVGGVKLSSRTNVINGETGIIRLPSNAFKVNYIDMFENKAYIGVVAFGGSGNHRIKYDSSDPSSIQKAIDSMYDYLMTNPFSQADYEEIAQDFLNNVTPKDLMKINRRFYYCDNYDPTYDNGKGRFISDYPINHIDKDLIGTNKNIPIVLTNDELQPTLSQPMYMGIYFKRGSNLIENFNLFDYNVSDHKEAYLYYNTDELLVYKRDLSPYLYFYLDNMSVGAGGEINVTTSHIFNVKSTSFSVNYIPMADIKIKYDNDGDTIDTNLFNQNGKLNDSNALSKVLLSHSKEIESETITRYGTFYGGYSDTLGFVSNLPQVGDVVYINDDYYVINNISLDFQPNENINEDEMGYYITAEVSMSKKVATKSLMTNPNTNIRDYGIPQNNNVKRKQLYRDFYEFSYESDDNASDNWLLPLNKVLNLSNNVRPYQEHIGVISCRFSHEVNGSDEYYYQLETTTYFLKKAIYEVLDFKDNNIIGYGFNNLWSGFDISKIFISGNDGNYNTPISYVDEVGEVEEINIRFATIEQLTQVYNDYTSGTQYEDISIYNASVFIPSDIYDNLNDNCDFEIEEPYYKKDALEVPVFEYSCQIDDTNEILVGENILDRGNNDVAYLYSYKLVDSGTLYNDNNFEIQEFPNVNVNLQNQANMNNAVLFDETHIADQEPYLLVKLYESQSYDIDDNQNTMGSEINLSQLDLENTTLLIVRNNLTDSDLYSNIVGELALNVVQANLPTAGLSNKGKLVVLDNGNYYECQPDQYSYHLGIGSNCSAKFTLVRDNINIYNDVTLSSDLDIDVYEGDIWHWSATPNTGYYIDGNSVESGTIHDSGYSHDIVSKHYQTISFTKGNGIESVYLYVDNAFYELNTNGQVITDVKQEWLYTFSTNLSVGWEIVSGGSQDTPIAIGENANNTLIIQPIAQRKTFNLTANISGSGSGKIILNYTDPDTGTIVVGEELENGDSISLKYGTNYSWVAQASSGSYLSGTASGSGIIGSATTIYTSFALYRSFTITTANHAQINGWVKRNGTTIKTISAVGGETITYNDLHSGDTYRVDVSAWGTAYYMPSGSTLSYSGTIENDVDLGTTDNALHYHIFNIAINNGVNYVRLTINGSSQDYNTTTNDIYIEQGKSYSWTTFVNTGYSVTSGGSGSGTTNGGTTNISPVTKRTKLNATFTCSNYSGIVVYFNYKDPDSGTTISESKSFSNGYCIFQVPYGTTSYSWTATSTISSSIVVSGGSGSYTGQPITSSFNVAEVVVKTRVNSVKITLSVSSSGGTSSSFAYARLVSTINYTQGAEIYTTTNNIFIEKAEDITSFVCVKKNGYGYTETITIRSEDRDNPSNYKTISVFFSPGSGANSTTPLNTAQINDLLFIG